MEHVVKIIKEVKKIRIFREKAENDPKHAYEHE